MWCMVTLPSKDYDYYVDNEDSSAILQKYVYRFVSWLSTSWKQLNNRWNKLAIFLSSNDKASSLNITSKLGLTISKSTYYRHRKQYMTNLISTSSLLQSRGLKIIWIDNFSRVLKHMHLNTNNMDPFTVNLWTIFSLMQSNNNSDDVMFDESSTLSIPLKRGIMSALENSISDIYTNLTEYYLDAPTFQFNITILPIKLDVNIKGFVLYIYTNILYSIIFNYHNYHFI